MNTNEHMKTLKPIHPKHMNTQTQEHINKWIHEHIKLNTEIPEHIKTWRK